MSELASTEGDPSAPFGTINDMLEVQPGVIAVADDVLHCVHAWTVESGRVRRLARRGPGPGEVETPMQLARRPGGGFALYDIGHSGILLYGPDLQHVRSVLGIGLISNTKDLMVLPDGSFVLAGGRLSDPRHLHRYTSDGERVEAWGEPPATLTEKTAQIQAAGGALRLLANGGFLFSFGAPLRVIRFPAGAGLQEGEIVTEDLELRPEPTDDELVRPGSRPGSRAFQWWFDRSSGILVLDDSSLLNVVTRHYQGDSVWDLYDPEGNRLARTVVDRAYYVHDLAHDGTIVAHYRDAETDEKVAVVLRLELARGD
ncbi:MAG TPA: hypothetical protein VGD06_06605 [Acidobacteriota bacterium]